MINFIKSNSLLWFYKNHSINISPHVDMYFTIDKDQHEKVVECFEDILKPQTPAKFSKEDKIYVHKNCSIPRYKIDDYIKTNNLTRVWSYKDADCVLIDFNKVEEAKELLDYYSGRGYSTFISSGIYDVVELPKPPQNGQYSSYNSHYIKNASTHFVVTSQHDLTKSYENYPIKKDVFIGNLSGKKSLVNTLEMVGWMVENPFKLKIIFDQNFIGEINKGGLEYNDELKETLENMLSSKNKDNINFAFEMISSFDLEKCWFDVALILNKYNWISYRGSGLTKTNMGYATVENFFIHKNIDYKDKWRKFVSNLLNTYPGYKHKVEPYIIERLNGEFEYHKLSIKLKNIELT